MKNYLWTSDDSALEGFLRDSGEPLFRRRQITEWLFKKLVFDPARMVNLPQRFARGDRAEFPGDAVRERSRQEAADGTVKLLLELTDGNTIEAVIIPAPVRKTFLSEYAGRLSGQMPFLRERADGLVRNLTTAELLQQFQVCCTVIGGLPDNLVFMGIGEGMLNLDELIPALEALSDPERFGLAARRITVSTSGQPDGIRRLADLGRQWTLALSLHASDDVVRARLIPDHMRYPIAEIMTACDYYREKSSRMVTFEYTLLRGENDEPEHAEMLAKLARTHHAKVNLIPYNEVPGKPYRRPERARIDAFLDVLLRRHVQATVRVEKGGNVDAACGQLRRRDGCRREACCRFGAGLIFSVHFPQARRIHVAVWVAR